MRPLTSRLPLILLGSFLGLLSQLIWLDSHGWEESAARIPMGVVGGGLVFWLLGELLARLLRRRGKDLWAGVGRAWPVMTNGTMWRGLAIAWIALIAGVVLGLYVYSAQIWPYPLVREVEAWVVGEGITTFGEKLANDFNLVPTRHLVTVQNGGMADRAYREVTELPLNERRLPPKLFISPEAPKYLRVIFGTFNFKDHRYGVILLGPPGQGAPCLAGESRGRRLGAPLGQQRIPPWLRGGPGRLHLRCL